MRVAITLDQHGRLRHGDPERLAGGVQERKVVELDYVGLAPAHKFCGLVEPGVADRATGRRVAVGLQHEQLRAGVECAHQLAQVGPIVEPADRNDTCANAVEDVEHARHGRVFDRDRIALGDQSRERVLDAVDPSMHRHNVIGFEGPVPRERLAQLGRDRWRVREVEPVRAATHLGEGAPEVGKQPRVGKRSAKVDPGVLDDLVQLRKSLRPLGARRADHGRAAAGLGFDDAPGAQ